jgi:V8-like Glu-specific endopeptidase
MKSKIRDNKVKKKTLKKYKKSGGAGVLIKKSDKSKVNAIELYWKSVKDGSIPTTITDKKKLANIMRLQKAWQKVKSTEHLKMLKGKLQEEVNDITEMKRIIFDNETESRMINDEVAKMEGIKIPYEACIHFLPSGSGCILSNGLIMTCAHCINHEDDPKEGSNTKQPGRVGRVRPIIWADGKLALVKCVYSNENTDIAFCKIIKTDKVLYDMAKLCTGPAKIGDKIVTVHNPFGIDLEDNDQGAKSGNLPFTTSMGKVEGYEGDKINMDNNGNGSLVHSCWTYWGTSGAPLFNMDGEVIGIHNSWISEEDGGKKFQNKKAIVLKKVSRRGTKYVYGKDIVVERRGIPWTAIKYCLEEFLG